MNALEVCFYHHTGELCFIRWTRYCLVGNWLLRSVAQIKMLTWTRWVRTTLFSIFIASGKHNSRYIKFTISVDLLRGQLSLGVPWLVIVFTDNNRTFLSKVDI